MFNLYRIILYLLISSLLWTYSCNFIDEPEEEAVITIGDVKISIKETREEIDRFIFDMGITDQDARSGIKSIIDKIVEKKLILEYGKKNGITVSSDELENAVKTIRQDYPEDVFNEILLKRYIDINEWKKNLNEELLIKRIVETALRDSIGVSYEEAKEYYEKHK